MNIVGFQVILLTLLLCGHLAVVVLHSVSKIRAAPFSFHSLKMKLLALVALVVAVVESQPDAPARLDAVVINGTTPGSCPSMADLDAARMSSAATVDQLFNDAPCGGLGWTQIVSFDMEDQAVQCPPPFVESATPQRSCIPVNGAACPGVTVPTPDAPFTRVCGRIAGYGVNTPDAFFGFGTPTINDVYLDGVSVTTEAPRQHIWSLAAGHGARFGAQNIRCPCGNTDRNAAPLPPAFVGDNYFCDTLDNTGPSWDGMGCTDSCCTFNDPPEFTVTLPAPTSLGIEIRICHNQAAGDETIHIRSAVLYVQ